MKTVKTEKKPVKKTKEINLNKKPVGRPTKYLPIYAEQAKKLAIKGLIDKEIYDILGISEVTGIEWKKKYPDFAKFIKEGKEFPDYQVVKSLFENALGGEYETEKALVVSDGSQIGSHVEKVRVKEWRPGNVTAQIYWTKNRLPKEWRDKQDVEHSGTIETITPTKEQLREMIDAIKSSRNIK
jgi:hypothetical protein